METFDPAEPVTSVTRIAVKDKQSGNSLAARPVPSPQPHAIGTDQLYFLEVPKAFALWRRDR